MDEQDLRHEIASWDELPPQTVELMITVYSEMAENWRHADRRVETAINFYITVVSLLVAATGILYRQGNDRSLLFLIFEILAVPVVLYGYSTVNRIKSAAYLRTRYLHSVNLSQEYFKIKYPHLIHFLGRYRHKGRVSLIFENEDEFEDIEPSYHDTTSWFIYIINSIITFAFVLILLLSLTDLVDLFRKTFSWELVLYAVIALATSGFFLYRNSKWLVKLEDFRE